MDDIGITADSNLFSGQHSPFQFVVGGYEIGKKRMVEAEFRPVFPHSGR